MLVLSRNVNEGIIISDNIHVRIISVRGRTVRLGITAPKDLPVNREEIIDLDTTKLPGELIEQIRNGN
jgi:carbon storage regulator